MHGTERRAKVLNVVRVSSGNFLEMFDFMVFGYYASSIGHTFFPNENAFVSLMLALMTFGAGFLMRPIGAVILGAYIDRFGRRAGLILTLCLMAIGTLLIACLPGYAVIGVAAPIVILISRLVVVMLTEIMPVEVRTTGFSLAYSLATALFGGNTPAICTYLIHITNNKAMPGVWMSAAALVGLVAALLVGGRRMVPNAVGLARSV